MSKKKILVVVAHPDDETIWCGGTLIRNKDVFDITIISLCRKDDLDRAPKFFKAAKEYNANSFISDLDDDNPEKKLKDLEEIKKRIMDFIDGNKFDFIYTHGDNGEYGHNRHIEVNKAMKELIFEKKIFCKKVFFFSYKKNNSDKLDFCVPKSSASTKVELLGQEYTKKKFIIENVYGFTKESFESCSCNRKEAFDVVEK